FTTAVYEEAFVQIARCPLGQRTRESCTFLRQNLRRHAAIAAGLLLDRLDDAAVAVAPISIEKLCQEIKIIPSMIIIEVDAFGMIEFEDGVFTILHSPGEKVMFSRRSNRGHRLLRDSGRHSRCSDYSQNLTARRCRDNSFLNGIEKCGPKRITELTIG